jgi:hypothetical protein
MNNSTIIQFNNVTKQYDNDPPVLDHVSFEIERGKAGGSTGTYLVLPFFVQAKRLAGEARGRIFCFLFLHGNFKK